MHTKHRLIRPHGKYLSRFHNHHVDAIGAPPLILTWAGAGERDSEVYRSTPLNAQETASSRYPNPDVRDVLGSFGLPASQSQLDGVTLAYFLPCSDAPNDLPWV